MRFDLDKKSIMEKLEFIDEVLDSDIKITWKDRIEIYWDKFKDKLLDIHNFFINVWKFRKFLIYYRWWEWGNLFEMFRIILKDWEKHYGTDTWYIGGMIEKIRARELLYLLEKWEYYDNWMQYEKAKYYRELFFDKLSKWIQYFWD